MPLLQHDVFKINYWFLDFPLVEINKHGPSKLE